MNYTYASNLAYSSGDLSCCLIEPWDLNNLAPNRAMTNFHIRHNFTTDFLYEVPVPGNVQGAARHLLGGWQLGGILTLRGGNPLNISQSSSGAAQRPDIVGSSHAAGIRGDHPPPLANGTYQYLNVDAFAAVDRHPASGQSLRQGTLSRNAIYGPGFGILDASIQKNIFLSEKHRLQLRVELFNRDESHEFSECPNEHS